MEHIVTIKSVEPVTHDVLRFVLDKPARFSFVPGQAAEIAINKKEWQQEKRPFTFTCLPEDDYLEFTIKTYPSRKGVTNELRFAKINDELILHDVFGAIAYKGTGVFIAGGAGVTPFISIFRQLQAKNSIGNNELIFANKTKADIILEQELKSMLGKNFIGILSDEKTDEYAQGHITEEFLKANVEDFNQKFYLCGPPPMMEVIEKQLKALQVDEKSIVKEEF